MYKVLIFGGLLISSMEIYSQNLTQYINPMIGTGGHGHTFPGTTYPFGMVQLSPDTRIDGSWDGCSGYHYSDSVIYGFSHTHLSGTGCSDYGDISYMPYFSETGQFPPYEELYNSGVGFSHKNEIAKAGYYSVVLNNGIQVELVSTRRAGMQKYTMSKQGYVRVILNLKHRDKLLEGVIRVQDLVNYSGKRVSRAWANHQELYFHTQTTKLPKSHQVIKGKVGDEFLILDYEVNKGDVIFYKTGISAVSEKSARLNSDAEMPKYDFEALKINGNGAWNFEMSKIMVSGGTEVEKTNFYTALYHCMIHPSIASDVDEGYRGRDGQVHNSDGHGDYYSVFSLWDTYRSLHPLLNLIDGFRSNDMIQSFVNHHDQIGRLPIWELWGNETNCMIGYHAVSVINDAFHKGIRNYNLNKIYAAMRRIATENTPALNSYRKYGYVRAEDDAESVSKTLEYAYNDWCIARMAEELGVEDDIDTFGKRSRSWLNVYDPETGYMRPRFNGGFLEPFSPYTVDNNYTEANSFQYSFYVPHDMKYFKKIVGGDSAFDRKLDALFAAKPKTEGREQADITGLIGQYAHGNEPSHHIAFLYTDTAKRNRIVKYIRDSFYKNTPDGLIGNEDCGAMSAWYVWAAMGMYPVCPGSKVLTTCEGIFDTVKIKADIWTITRTKNSTRQLYNIDDYYTDMVKGYNIKNTQPYISGGKKSFSKSQKITMHGLEYLYYKIDNGPYQSYKAPITIDKTCTLSFYGTEGSYSSFVQEAKFYKLPDDVKITLTHPYNPSYHAGGSMALVDGIYGDVNWRRGDWQGFQKEDFEALIEYNNPKKISEISINLLEDQRSWIYFPTAVEIYTSSNGKDYQRVQTQAIEKSKEDAQSSIKKITMKLPLTTKYLKVLAKNYGKLPVSHPGAGGDAFIFVDEIEVK